MLPLQWENENNGNKIVSNIFCFSFTSLIVADASKKICKIILIQLHSVRYFCFVLINNSPPSPFRSTLSHSTDVKLFFGKHRMSMPCAVPLTSSYFCVSFKWLEFQVYKFLMNPNCNFRWRYLTDQLFSIHRVNSTHFPPLSAHCRFTGIVVLPPAAQNVSLYQLN